MPTGSRQLPEAGSGVSPIRIVIATTGSWGDVFPMIGFGRALRERGHEVTLVSSGDYRDHASTAGLDFVEELSGAKEKWFGSVSTDQDRRATARGVELNQTIKNLNPWHGAD